jgi:U6 snRNA-associated Sm-like protein LSm1
MDITDSGDSVTVQTEGLALPGAASLIEEIDKRVLIILRDGRHLVGTLRSFDHFMNLVLENTFERVLLKGKYSDIELGLYIVRGDTIVLMGEVDEDKEKSGPLVKVDYEDVDESDHIAKNIWDFQDS